MLPAGLILAQTRDWTVHSGSWVFLVISWNVRGVVLSTRIYALFWMDDLFAQMCFWNGRRWRFRENHSMFRSHSWTLACSNGEKAKRPSEQKKWQSVFLFRNAWVLGFRCCIPVPISRRIIVSACFDCGNRGTCSRIFLPHPAVFVASKF